MKKIFEKIAFYIILLLAFIGSVFISTAMHEVSHYDDLHQYVTNDYICAFVWPNSWDYFKHLSFGNNSSPLAYYSYYLNYNKTNITLVNKVNNILNHTEFKAYVIAFIILILFFIAAAIQILERMSNKNKSKLLDDLEEEIKENRNI
jgi:uncharacterized membrane protein